MLPHASGPSQGRRCGSCRVFGVGIQLPWPDHKALLRTLAKPVVLDCRRCRSRPPSVLEHDDLSSRLSICWSCSCRGHTSWLHIGFILRVLSKGHLRVLYSDHLLGATVLILSIYMGPVARQVDHQAIQSILCCAYITTIVVIFITIGLRIFRVFGSIEFSQMCIHTGPVACQVDYHQATQAIQSILCCAYITILPVISIMTRSRRD